MKDSKHHAPATDAVKCLHWFLTEEQEELSDERIVAALQAAGIDPAKSISKIKQQLKQAQNRSRLADIRSRLENKTSSFSDFTLQIGRVATDLIAEINGLIESIGKTQPAAAAVFYRKLKESRPEDLESLLADLRELAEEGAPGEDQGRS
jgi:hypothetical protein